MVGNTETAVGFRPPPPSSAAAATHDGAHIKKRSSWNRVRWSDDEVVRLLIGLVALVDDEVSGDPPPGAVLQRKGKWKAVSKLMVERGFSVSPQQCEDKFNELNKRYKRLTEILGLKTGSQVVRNPELLDSMPVSPNSKETVRKILNFKHLFYKEMCAYHNGDTMPVPLIRSNVSLSQTPMVTSLIADAYDDDGDEEEEEEENDDEGNDKPGNWVYSNLRAEIHHVIQDRTKSSLEQLEWIQGRGLQLMEDRVGIESKALELKKRCFEWEKFRREKDFEMERTRLENERMMLENERMSMWVKKKELELTQGSSGGSTEPAAPRMERDL